MDLERERGKASFSLHLRWCFLTGLVFEPPGSSQFLGGSSFWHRGLWFQKRNITFQMSEMCYRFFWQWERSQFDFHVFKKYMMLWPKLVHWNDFTLNSERTNIHLRWCVRGVYVCMNLLTGRQVWIFLFTRNQLSYIHLFTWHDKRNRQGGKMHRKF